jgi:hypothetical protein
MKQIKCTHPAWVPVAGGIVPGDMFAVREPFRHRCWVADDAGGTLASCRRLNTARRNAGRAGGLYCPASLLLPVQVEIETGEIEMIKEAPVFKQA